MNTILPNKILTNKIIRNPLCFGLYQQEDGFCFSVNLNAEKCCGLLLWDKKMVEKASYEIAMKDAIKIIFSNDIRIGNVYSGFIKEVSIEDYVYCFFCDDNLISDNYGRAFLPPCFCEIEKKDTKVKILLAYVLKETFTWERDINPKTPFENTIIYGIHVKGFTKHISSNVKNKGTYQGVCEKIDYIKQLGITALELMPSYEFISEEMLSEEDRRSAYSYKDVIPDSTRKSSRTNYWGYKKGYYFAPKASYSSERDVSFAFKKMVKELHENQIEIIMQFYFPETYYIETMIDALRFWVMEYHVDGFRLIGARIPKEYLAKDGILADTKLIFDSLEETERKRIEDVNMYQHIALLNYDYMKDIRRFLKGDENQMQPFLEHMYMQPNKVGCVHTITDYWGFTLHDLVSYDRKHNELNGENNKDGTNFNYSWNCGMEGATKKRKIVQLRKKLMKNAFCMLLLSQATPYIRAGDEFAFSQKGNNNPFCQDNEITWLDWNLLKKNKEQFSFVQDLIRFRMEHPILHMKKRIRVMDYLGCGYPDVSFHGKEAWRPVLDNVSRHIGILFCGKYAINKKNKEDDFIYITFNMHWMKHDFALPRLPKGKIWDEVFDTEYYGKIERTNNEKEENINQESVIIQERSVRVFMSKEG